MAENPQAQATQAAPQSPESPVEQSYAAMLDYAKKTSDVTLKFFIRNFLAPHLDLMRDEYLDGMAYLDSKVDSGGEDGVVAFIEQAKALVKQLDKVIALSFRAVGWIDGVAPTEAMPDDVKAAYVAAASALPAFLQAAEELMEEDEGDEDDEEEDDEEEEAADGDDQ